MSQTSINNAIEQGRVLETLLKEGPIEIEIQRGANINAVDPLKDLMDFSLLEKRTPAYKTQSKKITFSDFVDGILKRIAEGFSLPIEMLLNDRFLYSQYRHMWE